MNNAASEINKNGTMLYPIMKTWAGEEKQIDQEVPIPEYLEKVYWWAYVRPYAIKFFDRPWIVNLILLGNMVKLRDRALDALGQTIPGRTLQIASVYGDFVQKLTERLADDGSLDLIDVVPAQLENLRRKLSHQAPVRLIQNDASYLKLSDDSYDQVVIFFLLHEMPAGVREKTLSEGLRVLKPGGRLVIVDFHKPHVLNPLRYLYPLMFKVLEPFALDIWRDKIEEWLPKDFAPTDITKETMFGGVYQRVVIHK
jgi:ubiquinone/menaquinone biosynthesis C-methylase UbiE